MNPVSGDSDFKMSHTGLTIGGFTQPSMAKTLICNPSNSDKDICQRFLWLMLKPAAVGFDELQQVDKGVFTSNGGYLVIVYNYIYTLKLMLIILLSIF